jgi:peptidoglycan/LPS O-acetylase OafA/YrhL
VDDAKTRTAFLGLFGGFVIYAFSLVAMYVFDPPWNVYVSTALVLVALVFGIGWVLAVRGGWRLGKSAPRSAKRRKDREKSVSPYLRR